MSSRGTWLQYYEHILSLFLSWLYSTEYITVMEKNHIIKVTLICTSINKIYRKRLQWFFFCLDWQILWRRQICITCHVVSVKPYVQFPINLNMEWCGMHANEVNFRIRTCNELLILNIQLHQYPCISIAFSIWDLAPPWYNWINNVMYHSEPRTVGCLFPFPDVKNCIGWNMTVFMALSS